MVTSVPFYSDDDPEAFLFKVDQITDPLILEQSLYYSVSQIESSWRLVEGYILWRLNRFDSLRRLLLTLPPEFHDHSQYWLLMGLAHKHLPSSMSLVEDYYRRALDLSPQRSDLNYNLANLIHSKDPSSALTFYKTSLDINPNHSHCWHNYGRLLRDQHEFKSSLSAFRSSLLLDPTSVSVLIDLGLLYFDFEYFDSAEKAFLLAISLDPHFSHSYINLGSLYLASARDIDAVRLLQTAIQLDPESSNAIFNLALCHLTLGHFQTGWICYEERLKTELVPRCSFPSTGPLVTCSEDLLSFTDNPLIIWSEQGLGDTIQFSRYLLLLQSSGVTFEFLCQKELLTLFDNWFVVPLNLMPLPDLTSIRNLPHCPLLSLPRLFDTQEFSIPSSFPYFISHDNPPDNFLVPTPSGGLSIGIVWASNPNNKRMYSTKSISLSLLMPLFVDLLDLDLINLHSLQVGPDQTQLLPLLSYPRVTDWSKTISDFSDTAHVVKQLDLVITVDTALAHLSASLGRPTWILLPFDADFRWLRSRSDSPWYPNSVRLFRQSSHNDWSTIVESLRVALNQLFHVDCQALATSKFNR